MEMLEQVWSWIQAHPGIVLNGVGGAVLGPMLAKLFRGGMGTGLLGGVLGGIGAGFGADAAGLNDVVSNNIEFVEDGNLLTYIQNLVEGAVGGGGIGGLLGAMMKRR